ncbi:type II toxin-antitoxin system ParD family antitoxin [Fulvimarina sp. MAC8]|uniref:ribbon-helix-helix domain-containing protein n=1 Tax=Fulvimarina sp. MAC8 TaxID=3162874 RepID=UPI0032ED9DC2
MPRELNVTLPSEMVSFIEDEVRSGAYDTTSDAVAEALEEWMSARDAASREQRLEEIRVKVKVSLADPRPSVPIDEVRSRLKDLYERDLSER